MGTRRERGGRGGVKSEMVDRWVVGSGVLWQNSPLGDCPTPGCPPPAVHTAPGSGSQIISALQLPPALCRARRGRGGPGCLPGVGTDLRTPADASASLSGLRKETQPWVGGRAVGRWSGLTHRSRVERVPGVVGAARLSRSGAPPPPPAEGRPWVPGKAQLPVPASLRLQSCA